MSTKRCASCNELLTAGCPHFPLQTRSDFPQKLIEESTKADPFVANKAQVYVPAQRDYSIPRVAGETRQPSVVIGQRGAEGVQGAQGPAGKDANISECIAAPQVALRAELNSILRSAIVDELKRAGVIDAAGKAVLIPGPAGRDGADGRSIVGRAGKDGQSIVGPAGRNGTDGQSIVGPPGKDGSIVDATKAAKNYVEREIADLALSLKDMILQILVERKVLDEVGKAVPGPEGRQGVPGREGRPGNIDAALANCEQLLEEKFAAFRSELEVDAATGAHVIGLLCWWYLLVPSTRFGGHKMLFRLPVQTILSCL
jgi:hypothetical protein